MSTGALLISNDNGAISTGSFTLVGANLNQTSTDLLGPDGTAGLNIAYPTGYTRFRVIGVYVSHASTSLTTATLSVYSAAAAGGTAIVADAALSGITSTAANTAANSISMTLGSITTLAFSVAKVFPRVGTAQ